MLKDSLSTGIISDPAAAHLDHYLEAIAGCHGLGPLAYADSTGHSLDQARHLLPGCRTYSSIERMLAETQPKLAIVLPEAHNGPKWIRAALNAGCDVLSDKHPAACAADLGPLFSLGVQSDRRIELAFSTRALPAVENACEVLKSGFGQLLGASAYITADQTRLRDPQFACSWRADRDRSGGGILMALGIHYVDLLLYLTGTRVRRVSCIAANAGGAHVNIEDAAAVALGLENGATLTLHAGFYLDSGYQGGLRLWFTQGWLAIDLAGDPQLTWERFDSPGIQAPRTSVPAAFNSTQAYFQKVIDGIRSDREPLTPLPYGLHVLQTVFAAYESSAHGQAVDLDITNSIGA
jgi:predicted dehydrogenase